MPTKNEPMAIVIARAIYEEPNADGTPCREFGSLSSQHQAAWLADAHRVIGAMRKSIGHGFQEFAYEMGAEWLAVTPRELWDDFFAAAAECGPNPNRGFGIECTSSDAEQMCWACNCWKDARASGSDAGAGDLQ